MLLLAGCQTLPTPAPERARAPALDAAEQAEVTGEYVIAAQEYERLAAAAAPPMKQQYLLSAAEALIKGGQIEEARRKLDAVSPTGLDPEVGARKHIVEARLALAEGAPEMASARLDEAAAVPDLSATLRGDLYELRARIARARERPFEALRHYVQRDQYVTGEAAGQNQLALWRLLESLPADALRRGLAGARDPQLAGWIELALVAREHDGDVVGTNHAIAQWRNRYPGHPAGERLLDMLALGAPVVAERIEHIALLLPLTSDYGVAAQAVRDGFLAMHARTPEAVRPVVTIYDLGSEPARTPEVYERAVREGAQVIVGPLGREAVNAIVRDASLAVPTLLLNHTDAQDTGAAPLFQFGLPPEQEARQAAERAYFDGCRQAGVLYAADGWGQRMMGAFVAHWQRLGGLVLANQSYTEEESDYSTPVKRLLNIPESELRRATIARLIGQQIAFQARPRRDLECLFLAADAASARLIKPQLNYHHARHVPVYATSHVYGGKPDPVKDADLDGIRFGDMPWMLARNGRVAELRRAIQSDWPYAGTDLDRLYALGVDSYAILPHLNQISTEAATRYPGVTSGLSLGPEGRLQRQLAWAQFRRGVPRLLDVH